MSELSDFVGCVWAVGCCCTDRRDLFRFPRLKDPGQERTESRTLTATRTSSKTAVRFCVGRHTQGKYFCCAPHCHTVLCWCL